MTIASMIRAILAASILAASILAACAGPPEVPTIEKTTFAPSLGVDLAASTKTANGEYYRDITAGTGAAIATGQTLSVHYAGFLANGTLFDTNAGGSAFSFTLGAGQVIQGWEEGFVGAHVGGARQLVIPPSLGYGAAGYYPIPPNAILVFTVEIDSAR